MANPYFNATYYLQNNPDLIAAGINTTEGAWAHYVEFGASEALNGAASRSPAPWFDINYYLSQNADLVTSGLTAGQLFEHFSLFGIEEGRAPSAEANVNSASLAAYAAANEDLRVAFGIEEGAELTAEQELALAQHFYAFGYAEGREGKPSTPATNTGETFTLTTSADAVVGTTGNDTIVAAAVNQLGGSANTLQAFDSIDGGAGNDTLNIYVSDDGISAFNAAQVGTIKNVETINIDQNEANAARLFGNGTVDASKFEGVTAINQIAKAGNVTNLGADTTAGFVNTNQAAALSVTAAAAAESASVVLNNVADGNVANGNAVVLNIAGAAGGTALNTVKVDGSIAAGTNTPATQSLTINTTVGKEQQTLNVESGIDATITFNDAASTKKVTAIDASASTGGITFTGDTDVKSLSTGAGKDTVTLNTAFTATVTSASVATGAGDDTITIITGPGTVTADAGAGDDKVTIANINNLSTKSLIDGGEGVDTVSTGGAALVNEQYTLLTEVVKNFEKLEFTGAAATFDASRLATYDAFDLKAGGTVTKVADTQALSTSAALDATANGYVAATASAKAVYAGNLDITANAGTYGVNAKAESVTLTVKAAAATPAAVTLNGDVKSADITVDSAFNNADGSFAQLGTVNVTTAAADLAALTTLTLSGTGAANVVNAASTALVTVNAAGLAGADTNADDIVDTGLIYTSNNAKAETITLGSGLDVVTINASTVQATDTITGFTLVATAAGGLDTTKSDDLKFEAGAYTKLGTVEASSLALALVDVAGNAAAGTGVVFAFGGDTYAFKDTVTNGNVDDADALIKLTGNIDQDLLVLDLAA